VTAINPSQYEVGQCCVITKRHVGTLLELTDEEAPSIIKAAQRAAFALVSLYQPLGVLTFQNNGVYSGQEVPHYHYHVVPRQPGSDWGIGPPQLAVFDSAGRVRGTPHDSSNDEDRRKRVQVSASVLHETANAIRECLPD
jgi:diadenosine tetraphosphate (Ap4A) HIT family hydrolase